MIDFDEIRTIADDAGFPRVSVYLPTHKTGPELRQDPIRLKNLLREAGRQLAERGLDPRTVDELLGEATAHADAETDPFWQTQDRGLAIFISPGETRYVQVPFALAEQVHVGWRFVVKPLLPALMRDGRFYVLAASQNGATLYRGSRYGLDPVRDARLDTSAEAFIGRTQIDNDLGFHGTRGAGSAQVHSLGESPKDETQEQVRRYAVAVASAVDEILANAQAPLVLAADDRMLGMLRAQIRSASVVADGIREHPTSLDPETLHQRAYDLVRADLDADRQAAMERFAARQGDDGAGMATRAEEIAPAAYEGRVEALVVAPDAAVHGVFSAEESRAFAAREPAENTIDLVDFAVLQTLAHGGAVYARPVDRTDDFPSCAAIYRY